MRRAVLEVVTIGAVSTPPDIERYVRCTLLAALKSFDAVANDTKTALAWLQQHTFVKCARVASLRGAERGCLCQGVSSQF